MVVPPQVCLTPECVCGHLPVLCEAIALDLVLPTPALIMYEGDLVTKSHTVQAGNYCEIKENASVGIVFIRVTKCHQHCH